MPHGAAAGKQLLSVWDRLCATLRAREVSVEDVSTKCGMLLRVLHTAATGRTWYGTVGYGFGRGSFGVTAREWQAAVKAVAGAKLEGLCADFDQEDTRVVAIVRHYAAPGACACACVSRVFVWREGHALCMGPGAGSGRPLAFAPLGSSVISASQ